MCSAFRNVRGFDLQLLVSWFLRLFSVADDAIFSGIRRQIVTLGFVKAGISYCNLHRNRPSIIRLPNDPLCVRRRMHRRLVYPPPPPHSHSLFLPVKCHLKRSLRSCSLHDLRTQSQVSNLGKRPKGRPMRVVRLTSSTFALAGSGKRCVFRATAIAASLFQLVVSITRLMYVSRFSIAVCDLRAAGGSVLEWTGHMDW
jgi:hypothetical protein